MKEKKFNLISRAHVVHTLAKQVISRHGKDKNGCEMYKNKERTCKACKITVFIFFKLINIVKHINLSRSYSRLRRFVA